ncbi:MAG: hypothetical protein ACE144_10140 [Thermodesulfobacteriota bacterium]
MAWIEENFIIFVSSIFFYFSGTIFLHFQKANNHDETYSLTKLFTRAYIFRILFAVVIYYTLVNANGMPFTGSDDLEYETVGREISSFWLSGYFGLPSKLYLPGYSLGYYVVNGFFQYLFNILGGYHILAMRFLNVLIGALIPVYVHKITTRVFGNDVSGFSTYASFLYPDLILYSSLQLKDIMIAFLFTAVIWQVVQYHQSGSKMRFMKILWTALLIWGVYFFRYPYALVLSLIVSLGILLGFCINYGRKIGLKSTSLLGNLSVLFLVVLLIVTTLFFTGIFSLSTERFPLGTAEKIEGTNIHSFWQFIGSGGDSASLALSFFAKMQSPLRQLVFSLLMLVSPYPPWHSLSGDDPLRVFPFLSGLFWQCLVPFAILGLVFAVTERGHKSFVLCATFLTMLIIVGNTYFLPRYLLCVMPAGFILCGVGINKRRSLPWWKVYYVAFHGALLSTYLWAKYQFLSLEYLVFILIAAIALICIKKKFVS